MELECASWERTVRMTTSCLGGIRDVRMRHCEELADSASALERLKPHRVGRVGGPGSISQHGSRRQGQYKAGGELNHCQDECDGNDIGYLREATASQKQETILGYSLSLIRCWALAVTANGTSQWTASL